MAIRNVYVHPGDLLIVHMVGDKEVNPSKVEFNAQSFHKRNKLMLAIHGNNEVGYCDFAYKFRLDNFDGTLKRWLE